MMATGKFDGKIVGKDSEELFNAALDNGVLGRGQYHADIDQAIEKELPKGREARTILGKAWKYTGSSDNPILQAGFRFGGGVENNARLALFIDRVNKGDDYKTAAQVVKKYLFDYEDLSPFEQQVMKRVAPFYTWSRKNIPLQIQAIASQPDKVQKLNIVKNNIEQGAYVPEPENVPDYVKGSGPIYISKTKEEDTARVFTLMNYLPLMDVGRIVKPDEFVGMLSPYMKAPFEYFTNYDTFRDKEIEQYKGQTTDFMGVRMPVHLAHVARNLVMLNEIDRANPGNIFGESTYDEKTGKRTRTRSFGIEEKNIEIPGIGYRKSPGGKYEAQTGEMKFGIGTPREERTDLPGMSRLLQYLFGFRLYNVNEEMGAVKNVRKFQSDLRQLKKLTGSAAASGKDRQMQELEEALDKAIESFTEKEDKKPVGSM